MVKPFSLNLKCKHCGKSLMDYKKKLGDYPSVLCNAKVNGTEGNIWLCSIYGCYDHESSIPINKNDIVHFACPHCHKELNSDILCKVCDANMVKFEIEIGGVVSICSRAGCKNHYVMFEDLADAIQKYYNEYGH